ncbi:MAG TPA: septal ring lytic transglycosylase RlpA family protein [Candidatus Binataceae bacterium]|nr:septal ring lytic transglycosylase RlpA family protein [Candidatus Binataceae bacterium]
MFVDKFKLLKMAIISLVLEAGMTFVIGGCTNNQYAKPSPPLAAVLITPAPAPASAPTPAKIVKASWYGTGFNGHVTATGEKFNANQLTAASTNLPLGSVVKVTNPDNGRSVKVRINDCGPYVHGRSMDLSKRAAEKIGITHDGVAHVKVAPVKVPANGENCS